jgi:cation transport ATPase
MARAEHSDVVELGERADRLRSEGATAIFLGIDGKIAGAIGIADPVKANDARRASRRSARRASMSSC